MIRLHDLPHHEARALLTKGAPVYLAFNPVEYHGPHLPLGCDRLIGRGVLGDFVKRMQARYPEWPAIVVDDIDCGVEPTSGRGSQRHRYPAIRALVRERCRALVELGARRAVLHTFHGSALHNLALEDGAEVFRRAGGQALAPFHLVLNEMIHFDPAPYAPALAHIEDEAEREGMLSTLNFDFHAGFFETSLALHYAGETVSPRYAEVPPCPPFAASAAMRLLAKAAGKLGAARTEVEMEFAAKAVGWPRLRPFPGYTGRPHHARASSGAFFAEHILDRYMEGAKRVFRDGEPPPAPIMRWLRALSLGGRIETTKVAIEHVDDAFLDAPAGASAELTPGAASRARVR